MRRYMDSYCQIPTDDESASTAVEAVCDGLARVLKEEILGIPAKDGRPMIKEGFLDALKGKELRFRIELMSPPPPNPDVEALAKVYTALVDLRKEEVDDPEAILNYLACEDGLEKAVADAIVALTGMRPR